MRFFNPLRVFSLLALCAIGLALTVSASEQGVSVRYLLFFKDARTGSLVCEERFLPSKDFEHNAVQVVREVLLGPMNHDFLKLIPADTPILSCFTENHAIYLNLPQSILKFSPNTADTYTVYRLIRKNLAVNCKDITDFYFYIDGRAAYEAYSTE